jgi:excisionase family DNA binding protein
MDLINHQEASKLLRISPFTVDKYVRQGLLKQYKTPGGRNRYYRDDVLSLITHRVSQTGEVK